MRVRPGRASHRAGPRLRVPQPSFAPGGFVQVQTHLAVARQAEVQAGVGAGVSKVGLGLALHPHCRRFGDFTGLGIAGDAEQVGEQKHHAGRATKDAGGVLRLAGIAACLPARAADGGTRQRRDAVGHALGGHKESILVRHGHPAGCTRPHGSRSTATNTRQAAAGRVVSPDDTRG